MLGGLRPPRPPQQSASGLPMPVLSPEARPDGPGFSRDSVFRPENPEPTFPGQFHPTFALFGRSGARPPTPRGGKSVCLTTGLAPDGPGLCPGPGPGRGRARGPGRPLLFFFAAAVVAVASVVCDQVDQVDQVFPAHQANAIDEVHQLDPVHQADHKDEHTFPHTT